MLCGRWSPAVNRRRLAGVLPILVQRPKTALERWRADGKCKKQSFKRVIIFGDNAGKLRQKLGLIDIDLDFTCSVAETLV